jgi:site-specific recombinase XerD
MDAAETRDLLDSWLIALEDERKSVNTMKSYATGVRAFIAWCEESGTEPDLTSPEPIRRWLAAYDRVNFSAATLSARLAAIRAFSLWLVAEGEIDSAGVERVGRPKLDEKIPPALTREQADAIIAVCARDKTFSGIRDEAMFSLMFDSLVRADELVSMTTGDVNLSQRAARVRRGKGGKERWTAFSAQTARRVDRYARARRRHKHADSTAYWLGQRGALRYSGLYAALTKRAADAGIKAHPHMLRAGGAITWRRRGGSTESLMTIAGWRDLRMVQRYTRAAEQELALEEARRLFNEEM